MPKPSRTQLLTGLLAAIAIVAHLALLLVRGTWPVVSGDEGTFIAMTASAALDGDLTFDERDRSRVESAPRGGRRAVILQTADGRVAYSKPAAYPVLAAPWFRAFGESGMVLLNLAALLVALTLAWSYLRQRLEAESLPRLGPAMATYVGTGVLLSYTLWTMSDSLQASMVIAGAALVLGGPAVGHQRIERFLASPWAAVLGGALLGTAAAMRYPNLLVAMAPVAAVLLERRWRRAALAGLVVILGLGASLALNDGLTGAPIPYKATRATFNPEIGYPAGEGADARMEHFDTARATHRLGFVPMVQAKVSAYAALYFVAGRHTGLLLYAPATLLFAWASLRRRDAVGLCLLAGVAALAVFYLLYMPRNYFGGATFLGNRYFLTGYALLLLAPRRLPRGRSLAAVWGLSLIVFVSALGSSLRSREIDGSSQMHAYGGIFRLLPYETTSTDLDGRRDRYWSDELIRFVDPWAEVEDHGFRLKSGAPAAEIIAASGREHGVVRFLVQAEGPAADVIYRDWGKTKRYRLRASHGRARGFLEIPASPALRRHPFWWDASTSLDIRSMRLSVETPEGLPTDVEFRYAGPYRFAARFYRGEVLEARLPTRMQAGKARSGDVRLQNTGQRYWVTNDPIPVLLGYRFFSVPARGRSPVAVGPFTRFAEPIEPGAVTERSVRLVAPPVPGRYELRVDLVVGGVRWFEEWTGEPLLKQRVTVLPRGTQP